MAAALAFYSLFSLLPGVLIVIAMANVILGKGTTENEVIDSIRAVAGAETAAAIRSLLGLFKEVTSGIPGIGVLALLLGATAVFADLHSSLNTIWRAAAKARPGVTGILTRRLWSFLMVLGIGFLLLVSLVLSAGLAAIGKFFANLLPGTIYTVYALQAMNLILSLGVISLLFASIFKFLPDAKIAWNDVWIGAAVTSLLFTIGEFLVGLYLGKTSVGSPYGAAGSLVVLLVWVYYSAQILFFGAEFTHVFAKRYGARSGAGLANAQASAGPGRRDTP